MEIIGKAEDYHISGFAEKAGAWNSAHKNGVEVIHLPTGIKVSCNTERSQHANRDKCMTEIKERLQKTEGQAITNVEIDAALCRILKANGSKLEFYPLRDLNRMRAEMLQIIKAAYIDGSNACHRAMRAE